ncbi:hypothetical protein ACFY3G_15100 [Streptomyces phaeochromogenes]|uniref:hypothetical protein n=1 Tax=Streptomyces phaeochromogenes TaxID=1923 RepID=UPI00368A8E16
MDIYGNFLLETGDELRPVVDQRPKGVSVVVAGWEPALVGAGFQGLSGVNVQVRAIS